MANENNSIWFAGIARIQLKPNTDGKTSDHIATDIQLGVSQNQDKAKFVEGGDSPGRPVGPGVKVLTQAFVQGIVANIHMAHQEKIWDSAEHLRYAISELERGFAAVADATKSKMPDDVPDMPVVPTSKVADNGDL